MMLIPVLLIVLIIFSVYKLADNGKHLNVRSNKALDILNIRYAAGEITEEEYTRRKELLEGK